MQKKDSLFLIDVAGLIYRFFFTLPPMTTHGGQPTNAAFGFARTLLSLNRNYNPRYLVPAMESKTPTFRHDLFPDYKAHREKMPDALRSQLPIVEEIISAMGLNPAQADGFEADDIIGTFARTAESRNIPAFIITGDKDLLQLVSDYVHVLMCIKGTSDLEEYDPAKVRALMGVDPIRIIDLKALEGDKSDNIPGVPGIGHKTAVTLLSRFDNIEDLYDNLDQIEGKALKNKLLENKNLAEISKRLATIKTDLSIELDLANFAFDPQNQSATLADVFSRYQFKSLIGELDLSRTAQPVNNEKFSEITAPFRTITDIDELSSFLNSAKDAGKLCIDLETTGLDTIEDRIVGFSLATDIGNAVYVPIRHVKPNNSNYTGDIFDQPDDLPRVGNADCDSLLNKQIEPQKALDVLRPFLEDPGIKKLGHNLKFDIVMLMSAGINMNGVSFDSMIASYLLNPSSRRHSLKTIASDYMSIHFNTYEDIVGKGKDQICFSEVDIQTATQYACLDVDLVLRLEQHLRTQLIENDLMTVLETIEIPLIPVLAAMEFHGVALDENLLKQISQKLSDNEKDIVAQIRNLIGKDINLNSPKQIAELLFDDLGLPPVRKRSTDVNVLEELQFAHDVIPLIMEYRQTSKLRSTYVDVLPTLIKKSTKRVHTSFNQHITATGRLSSSDPNLQNVPIRTEAGRDIRKAFVAGARDHVLIAADYSQVEIRLLADMSKDPALVNAFILGEDVHARTAAAVFGVDISDVSKDQRRYAKTINFGLIYGMREFNLARTLGISRQEAAAFIDNYFNQYPSVRDFIDRTLEQARQNGFVSTLFGRKRYVPEVNSKNKNEQQAGFRAAFNTIIQGTAADIIKIAMISIHNHIVSGQIKAKMILQVHDELVFEAPSADAPKAAQKIKQLMENCVDPFHSMTVPLIADVSIGPNWVDTTPI